MPGQSLQLDDADEFGIAYFVLYIHGYNSLTNPYQFYQTVAHLWNRTAHGIFVVEDCENLQGGEFF